MHLSNSEDELAPLNIRSRQWDYEVHFASSLNAAVELVVGQSEAFVVVDAQVLELHRRALAPLVDRLPTYAPAATEETKSLVGVSSLVDWLLANRAVRTSTIIAIGGGCIQDLVSFTAHLYYRGIAWVFLPTTVLSQADSCIGAKSGINVLPLKNMLGALHAPRRIVIAAEFLRTLPPAEINSGYGEILKLSVTSSRNFLPVLESALEAGGIRNPCLLQLIRASLIAKREVVEADELEFDLRRILNYGHSFGHALEALSGHRVPHGLAVLWGIDIINWVGVRWGITEAALAERLSQLMRQFIEYTLPLAPEAGALLEMVSRDKKVAGGLMHFVVLVREGELVIEPRLLDEELRQLVNEYLRTDYVFRRN